jgi:hypothetical protein
VGVERVWGVWGGLSARCWVLREHAHGAGVHGVWVVLGVWCHCGIKLLLCVCGGVGGVVWWCPVVL